MRASVQSSPDAAEQQGQERDKGDRELQGKVVLLVGELYHFPRHVCGARVPKDQIRD